MMLDFLNQAAGPVQSLVPGAAGHNGSRKDVAWAAYPAGLASIHDGRVGLAIWERPAEPAWEEGVRLFLARSPDRLVADGTPDGAAAALAAALPREAEPILDDLAMLAREFAVLAETERVVLRLETLGESTWSSFHVDAVGLRLVCCYAGCGMAWQDADGAEQELEPGEVAVLKGTLYPDWAPRVPHRSPPVMHLSRHERGRVRLVIDAAPVS